MQRRRSCPSTHNDALEQRHRKGMPTVIAMTIATTVLVALPYACSSSRPSALTEEVGSDTAPETPWIASGGSLSVARGLSSVFQMNGSFFIIGGCLDPQCTNRSGAVSRYDPIEEDLIPTSVTEIPLTFTIPSKTPVLPPTFVQGTFAGATAVVPVAFGGIRDGVVDVKTRPWLVGPCALYFTSQGNSSAPEVNELYHGAWGFSLDLSTRVYFERLPTNVPFRGNASCQAYGSRIFIVGGVLIDTLELVDTIDAFDTDTMMYIPNIHRHVEAIMSPAVTIDNHMLYVVGGQTQGGCAPSTATWLWTTSAASLSTRLGDGYATSPKGHHVHFCQSTQATAYYFPPAYLLNESLPLEQFLLPEVPESVVRRTTNGSKPGAALNEDITVAEMLRAFSFGGTLTVSSFSSVTTTLSIEHLGLIDRDGPPTHLSMLVAPEWQLQQVDGLGITHASVIMYLIPYVFFGCGLAVFSIGGVQDQPVFVGGQSASTSGAPLSMTGQIFQRFVGLSMPGIRGTPPDIELVDQVMNISLQPPMQGYLRLSDNAACAGNTVGTMDEPTNVSNDWSGTTISFTPLFPADQVYVCFSTGAVDINANLTNLKFFSAINVFHPFAVLQRGDIIPTPTPGGIPVRQRNILLASLIPVGCLLLFVAVFVWHRRRAYPHDLDAIDREHLLQNEDPKDVIIRQTTSDSRYTVVKRIGEGAFSSVYLVSPKSDPSQTYALKFMICADDRERLEAIKECETINTVQAHPNIIQLIDMFMNYEFGAKRAVNHLDEHDQAYLLTGSMHAIQIHRKVTTPQGVAGHTTGGTGNSPAMLTAAPPNERTPLSPASPSNQQANKRALSGLNTVGTPPVVAHGDGGDPSGFPTAPLNVHKRYLCLVMQYHPAGDLCRYTLRRAEALQRQLSLAVSNDSAELATAARKKSSTTSDDNASPPSMRSGNASTRSASSRHALSERQLLSIAYQVASVLQFLHAQRPPIVHRDLKPENILIKGPSPAADDPFIPIVVTDFGLAFIQEEHRKSGRGGGTRPYISPESWKGQTTTASDVWSLGCVLYALATQRLTAETVRVMFQDAKYPTFSQTILTDLIRSHCYSCEFGVFVATILEVDPKRRPTAEKLVRMFEVQSAPRPGEDDELSGYISFKRDAFGPAGAAALVPPECLESGLIASTGSTE